MEKRATEEYSLNGYELNKLMAKTAPEKASPKLITLLVRRALVECQAMYGSPLATEKRIMVR